MRSTIRNLVIEIPDGTHIPSIDKLMYDDDVHRFLITIPGRGPVCFRCQATGHTRQNCPAPYCRHCVVFTHSTEECTMKNSYARRTGEQQEEQVGDDPEVEKTENASGTSRQEGGGHSSSGQTTGRQAEDGHGTNRQGIDVQAGSGQASGGQSGQEQNDTGMEFQQTKIDWATDMDTLELFGDSSDLNSSSDSQDTIVDSSTAGGEREAKKAKTR